LELFHESHATGKPARFLTSDSVADLKTFNDFVKDVDSFLIRELVVEQTKYSDILFFYI
jgi:hypothetical protein